jgi:uncharacterized membrane protein YkvA (DUF1232 family)
MTGLNKESDRSIVSREVDRRKSKAAEYVRDPEKSKRLLDEAWRKANGKEARKGPLTDVWGNLTALLRLFRAYIRREYVKIPWSSIVVIVAAIIYFVSPIDLIPDFLPAAGFIDDAAVIAFVLGQIKSELDAFLAWERDSRLLDLQQDTIDRPADAP